VAVVLIYRALGLGDFLTGVPAYRALRRAFPEHRIVLAAPAAFAPLAALTGAIDEVVDTPPLGPAPEGAEIAVNLHGRGPESTERLRASNPGRLIAFDEDTWRDDEHEVQRWCRLLSGHGIPADPDDLGLDPPDVALSAAPGATVIHPGAASAARRWPAERWAQVARTLDDVVITGSPEERSSLIPGRPLDTDLSTLAATVAHARLVLCGDTGVAHLATAFGTPSIVLFGPTPPRHWGPPGDRPQHRVLWAGRRGDPHGATVDPGLLEVTVDQVLHVLRDHPAANLELRG